MPSQPEPSLLEAISSLSQVKGSQGRFITKISRDWCTQHSVLGGYLTALIASAAQRYINTEPEVGIHEAKYPDPAHVFIQFLRMVPPGQVSISCRTLRTTSRMCVVNAELEVHPEEGYVSDAVPSQQSLACTAIVTLSDLDKETGLTQGTAGSTIHPLPSRQMDCVIIDDPVVDATPVTRKLHWVAPRSPDGLWGHRLGGHQREVWLSFRDGSKISDLLHLALLADMPLQPPATHKADFYMHYALSTLCLSVEFKKRPEPDTEWVLLRSNAHKVANGRYDVNIQILNGGAEILALSNHVVYVSGLKGKSGKKARM